MPAYSWLSWGDAKQELGTRLGPDAIFWSDEELGLYLTEALRLFNCLCQSWDEDYPQTFTPPFSTNWFPANAAGSPRQQTLTDTDVYKLIQYHLLEPPTGQVWTGTNQFNIDDLAQACSRRRNEILQVAACNMAETPLPIPAATNAIALPDNILDVRRVRWVPTVGTPVTLQRGDAMSFQRYTPGYRQANSSPLRWDVLGSSPQMLSLDANVNVPGTLQVLGIMGAVDFSPPTPSGLLIPDDWAWVIKYGAMADVLSMEQEGKDLERAEYCRLRYSEGLKLMQTMPWLLQAFIDNYPVDTQALAGADRTNVEWQSRSTAFPEIVVGGIDLFAISPVPTAITSVTLKVLANAPIPTLDADQIQISRDAFDAVISEAQHLALFKCGGKEATDSLQLHKEFIQFCLGQNKRLKESGIFAADLRAVVPKQEEDQPRWAEASR